MDARLRGTAGVALVERGGYPLLRGDPRANK
jgi:hypothetical protein